MELKNKVALVTGAGSGIGQAIALRLGRAGAQVVVNDLDEMSAEKTIEKLKDLGAQGMAFKADISDPDAVRSMVAEGNKEIRNDRYFGEQCRYRRRFDACQRSAAGSPGTGSWQ